MKKISEGRERLRLEAGLDDFKLPRIQDNQPPTKALVIACSESAVLSAFVASLDPLCILQNLGGILPSSQFLDDLKHKDDYAGLGTGLPPDARQIISRVGRGFGPPGAVVLAVL